MLPLKQCATCLKVKPIDMFSRRASTKDGHYNHCKECDNSRKREEYKANPEKFKGRSQFYHEKRRHRITALEESVDLLTRRILVLEKLL